MKTVIVPVLLCCSFAVQADNGSVYASNWTNNTDVMVVMGLTHGGGAVTTTADGKSLYAGGRVYLAAGGVYHLEPYMDIQVSYGYQSDQIDTTSGPAKFTRNFIELVPFYVTEQGHRFGVGFAHILSPEFRDSTGSISFKNTSGTIFEGDWQFSPGFYIGVRHVHLTYQDVYNYYYPLDGSYTGVILQANF